jgi:hypothetical protein
MCTINNTNPHLTVIELLNMFLFSYFSCQVIFCLFFKHFIHSLVFKKNFDSITEKTISYYCSHFNRKYLHLLDYLYVQNTISSPSVQQDR